MKYKIKRFSKIELIETERENDSYKDYEWLIDGKSNSTPGEIIGTTKKYDNDAKEIGEISKKKIKKLKKEISDGYVFHSPPGDPNESDTHSLSEHSNPKASLDSNKQITCSKDINLNDRFIYKVKYPEKDKKGKLRFPIVLHSCKGHWRLGVGRYSGGL